ncbi:FecR domain-containing protein [Thauera sinica]|uniref:FecR domain-containing protein n=1 Tax=Thauera sinica TaxID=2665146 RepID=A0ABW1ATX8_9RHOO|nr:FecR family protein [Thauera sp. K11]ATE58787.1 hypothetical protein CCZ27_01395 [Thauera sp. K11]
MKVHRPSSIGAAARAFAVLLACLVLAGCAPLLVDVMREDPQRPGRYLPYGGAEWAGAVQVSRGGRPLAARLPAALQPGDVVQTGADAFAVIRYPDGGEIMLDRNTRVRTGSLFVEFGRILARVRGLFEVETENVVTGVEGTEYVLQVARGGALKIVVLDGVVVCRSRTGRWSPVRLQRGEMLVSDYPDRTAPRVQRAPLKDWEEASRWSSGLGVRQPEPVRTGYCCESGRLRRGRQEDCRGFFSTSEREAAARCERARPDEAQTGYCCSGGRVDTTTRARCEAGKGSFHADAAEARRACRVASPVDTPRLIERVRPLQLPPPE